MHNNRTNLAKADIFFPETFGEVSHIKLSAYADDENKINAPRMNLGLVNSKTIQNFRHELEKSFQDEIKNQNCGNLLLSGEHMHSQLERVEDIQLLKKFLDKFVNKYKIVVYLRPQHEMALSFYSTYCKAGGTLKTVLLSGQWTAAHKYHNEKFASYPENDLVEVEPDENDYKLNYEKLLERWSKVFGSENIIPKIFSRTELLDGDIKKDFINFLGLNWEMFEDVKNSNENLNADAQRFFLGINKFLPRYIENKPNNAVGNIVRLVSKNRNGKGLMPTRQQAENFYKVFADSNERVRKKWFPGKKELFKVDFSIYPEKQFTEVDYTFAFKIFAEIWLKKQKELLSLIEQNKELENKLSNNKTEN